MLRIEGEANLRGRMRDVDGAMRGRPRKSSVLSDEFLHARRRIRDLEAAQIEAGRERALSRMERDILELVAKGQSLQTVLQSLVKKADEISPGATSTILLPTAAGRTAYYRSTPCAPEACKGKIHDFAPGPRERPAPPECGKGRVVVMEDPHDDSQAPAGLKRTVEDRIHRTCRSFPIRDARGDGRGAFEICLDGRRRPTPFELRVAETAADLAGLAVERCNVKGSRPDEEEQCRSLFRRIPVMLHSIDRNGRFIGVSDRWLKSMGYKRNEVIGRKSTEFLTEASRKYAEEIVLPQFFKTGVSENIQYQFVRKNQEVRDVLLSEVAERNEEGEVTRSLSALVDVTDHKRAENEITRQNEFLKSILESLTYPFYVLNAKDYRIQMANSATGMVRLNETITTCYALTHKRASPCDGREHSCPLEMVKRTKKPVTVEHVHYDPNGVPKNVEVHAYPIFDSAGDVAQVIEYSFDITERKRMEEELRMNAEKTKLFAYSVSHDLKSPIIGIHGLARLLHRQYASQLDEKGRKYCDQIVKATEQIAALIEEINVYIRTKETPLHYERFNPLDVLHLLREEFDALLSMRQIAWSAPESIPEITADRVSFIRVFRNMVENALKYGGEELSEIRITHEEREQFHVFSVSDDGVGLKQEDCEKVFGLFQREGTSKGTEGTGLGLAIVKELVKKHGGEVWAEPGPDKGAVFHISLSKLL